MVHKARDEAVFWEELHANLREVHGRRTSFDVARGMVIVYANSCSAETRSRRGKQVCLDGAPSASLTVGLVSYCAASNGMFLMVHMGNVARMPGSPGCTAQSPGVHSRMR